MFGKKKGVPAMKKLCSGLYAALLFFSLLLPINAFFGVALRFRLRIDQNWAYFLVLALLALALAVVKGFSGKGKENCHRAYFHLGYLSLICFPFCFCREPSELSACIGGIYCLACLYLSIRYSETTGGKIVSAVFFLLLIVPTWFFCLLGSIGYVKTVRTEISPDGRYVANVVNADEGALGGSSYVEVHRSRGLDLGFMEIDFGYRQVWYGEWWQYDHILLSWREDNSLAVNSKTCFQGKIKE